MIYLPERILFMKVGDHAGENWYDILARKRREIEVAGRSFWGYGGNTLHPISRVQPFAKLALKEQGGIFLVMEPIRSNAHPDILPATQFSRDGITWQPIPEGINVLGSRYAMILDEIRPGDLEIDFAEYVVAVGPCSGKSAPSYLQGRVDKGCFVRKSERRVHQVDQKALHKVGVVARLKDPFAVLLR